MANENLGNARKTKNDEFYTQLSDIEKELKNYKAQFKGKTVFCNCDDPYWSDFFYYFVANFNTFGLKKLITTHYIDNDITLFENIKPERPYSLTITKAPQDLLTLMRPEMVTHIIEENGGRKPLKGDGDFRSDECIELLKSCDIVVTNPPFSLFREYISQLVEHNKKFLIIGNVNAVSYKETFKLIKENKLWLGQSIHSGDREFMVPDSYPLNAAGFRVDENGRKFIRVKGVRWFTNLDYKERHENLILYKKYNSEEYPKYDNYDAINVNKTSDIPIDYSGIMGVPITFLDKYNPSQFEIIGITNHTEEMAGIKILTDKTAPFINSKGVYVRILIRNHNPIKKK